MTISKLIFYLNLYSPKKFNQNSNNKSHLLHTTPSTSKVFLGAVLSLRSLPQDL